MTARDTGGMDCVLSFFYKSRESADSEPKIWNSKLATAAHASATARRGIMEHQPAPMRPRLTLCRALV